MRAKITTDETDPQADAWYVLRASNAEPLYGFGSAADANRYAAWLNSDRETGCYTAYLLDNPTHVARLDADGAQGGGEGIDLAAELAAIDDDEA